MSTAWDIAWDIASDEDVTTGFMLAADDMPTDPDALLGAFIVLAAREWDTVYDPNRLDLSAEPAGYIEEGDMLVPAGDHEPTSRWWVITGLADAACAA